MYAGVYLKHLHILQASPTDKLHPEFSSYNFGQKVKKKKAIQSKGFRSLLNPLFIEHKLTINTEMENTSKPYPQF